MALESLIAPGLAANIWTILASAVVSLGGSLIVIKAAQIKTAPAAEEAITNRIKAADERTELELERMEGRIEDLEAQVGRLEIILMRERAWGDEVEVISTRAGVILPPRSSFARGI